MNAVYVFRYSIKLCNKVLFVCFACRYFKKKCCKACKTKVYKA